MNPLYDPSREPTSEEEDRELLRRIAHAREERYEMNADKDSKRPKTAELLRLEVTHCVQVECEKCKVELEIIATPQAATGHTLIIVAPCRSCVAQAEDAGWYGRQMHELPPVGDPGNPWTPDGGPHEE